MSLFFGASIFCICWIKSDNRNRWGRFQILAPDTSIQFSQGHILLLSPLRFLFIYFTSSANSTVNGSTKKLLNFQHIFVRSYQRSWKWLAMHSFINRLLLLLASALTTRDSYQYLPHSCCWLRFVWKNEMNTMGLIHWCRGKWLLIYTDVLHQLTYLTMIEIFASVVLILDRGIKECKTDVSITACSFHPGLRSHRISALITSDSEIISADQLCSSSDLGMYITWESLNSAKKSIFQSSKRSAEEHCFSIGFFWNSTEQRWW